MGRYTQVWRHETIDWVKPAERNDQKNFASSTASHFYSHEDKKVSSIIFYLRIKTMEN